MFWKCIYSHYLVTETLCDILLYICLSNLTNDIESSMIIGHSHQTKLFWHYCPPNTMPTLPSCPDKRDEGRCLSLLREVKRALSHQQETRRKRITFHSLDHRAEVCSGGGQRQCGICILRSYSQPNLAPYFSWILVQKRVGKHRTVTFCVPQGHLLAFKTIQNCANPYSSH